MMDHPNIAKVLDAGTPGAPVAQASSPASSPGVPPGVGSGGETPPKPAGGDACATLSAGRPYFVMELVRGIRITDYCDQANLTTKDRLDLFIKVCQAIQPEVRKLRFQPPVLGPFFQPTTQAHFGLRISAFFRASAIRNDTNYA